MASILNSIEPKEHKSFETWNNFRDEEETIGSSWYAQRKDGSFTSNHVTKDKSLVTRDP